MPALQAPPRRNRARAGPEGPHPVGGWKIVALRLAGGAVVLWGLLALLGVLVTHILVHGPMHSADLGVVDWFASHRTGVWNTVTAVGADLAQTQTAIAVALVVVLLLRWRLGRWYESWIVVAAMAGELLVFFAVTAIVHRPRPPVARLDVAPPTSSFPSGHTAAAVALYGCIALLVLYVYGRRLATRVAAAVLFSIPVVVGLSRLYRGMHYPSDVLAGALMGGLWLVLVFTTLLPRQGTSLPRQGHEKRRAANPAVR
jgi:membrane-associated phospholipid phosphatase